MSFRKTAKASAGCRMMTFSIKFLYYSVSVDIFICPLLDESYSYASKNRQMGENVNCMFSDENVFRLIYECILF